MVPTKLLLGHIKINDRFYQKYRSSQKLHLTRIVGPILHFDF
ncbi:hypothetical protein LEP1GSC173_3171 [Leptospira interrogans str. HAI1594]|nr:hypothetical protein LEP1GSC117_2024 [Leptospira interrogans serovar Icterohaemorrhagiae str. Verdun LP]EKP76922.1 hypothetical protein LEP1GSC173_3171 [Leptospira interrogans str. HAI1594]EMJ51885.1 hypothetical protein LEP1GSC111_0413 [Leptospira interrogans str. UT126]EMN48141.1 hypothetical protein LEP1GSC088_4815 [Leptospira interrogans str. L1207]EMO16146.1 hypothetical protein LEP1GSC167_4451 [Leptospira interrogans serovar Copenhageni str. HAI0188]EMO37935.1 hypothetical protein LEP